MSIVSFIKQTFKIQKKNRQLRTFLFYYDLQSLILHEEALMSSIPYSNLYGLYKGLWYMQSDVTYCTQPLLI